MTSILRPVVRVTELMATLPVVGVMRRMGCERVDWRAHSDGEVELEVLINERSHDEWVLQGTAYFGDAEMTSVARTTTSTSRRVATGSIATSAQGYETRSRASIPPTRGWNGCRTRTGTGDRDRDGDGDGDGDGDEL